MNAIEFSFPYDDYKSIANNDKNIDVCNNLTGKSIAGKPDSLKVNNRNQQ